eukprot:scaffold1343_cov369-Prasinococcus_capsulatus_cf.AAC.1
MEILIRGCSSPRIDIFRIPAPPRVAALHVSFTPGPGLVEGTTFGAEWRPNRAKEAPLGVHLGSSYRPWRST